MNGKILVAYASKYGSTQEVAEKVAIYLKEGGLDVDIQPMKKVQTISEYSMVVLGAPLYFGHWHKDAQKFLSINKEVLKKRRLAFFTIGPISLNEKEWQDVRMQLDQEMEKYSSLGINEVELFGGKYDSKGLRFPDSMIAKLPASPLCNTPDSDIRDWMAIASWAKKIAENFLSNLSI